MAEEKGFNPREALRNQLADQLPASAPAPETASRPGMDPRIVRLLAWFGLMAAGIVAAVPMLGMAWREVETWSLTNTRPTDVRGVIVRDWSQSNSPDALEIVAELSLNQPVADEASAYVAAKRAVELDPSRAFAWATLAYLEMRHAGGVNQTALDALSQSMDACPLCDTQLIRWRFNFVLANWEKIPEAMRRRAFEHADLLRWIGPNEEFLAEMRVKARLAGIPFDAYRAAVNTPVRTWDIMPAATLRGVREPQG